VKIGVSQMFGNSPYRGIDYLKDFAVITEELGFHSLWAPEHIVFFRQYESDYPYKENGQTPWKKTPELFDPLLVCSVAASVTTTLKFGTTVLVVPERPALLIAKEVMTLDHITKGRFELGVGLGWSKEEYEALGAVWEKRGKRFDEYLDVIKLVWKEDIASYSGEFVNFQDVVMGPKPLTVNGPPILIGGNSPAALKRAARFDGWYGVWMGFDDLEPILENLNNELLKVNRSLGDGFLNKLNLPVPAGISNQDIIYKVDEARRLGVDEFVLELPIRSRHLEEDLTEWSKVLEL